METLAPLCALRCFVQMARQTLTYPCKRAILLTGSGVSYVCAAMITPLHSFTLRADILNAIAHDPALAHGGLPTAE